MRQTDFKNQFFDFLCFAYPNLFRFRVSDFEFFSVHYFARFDLIMASPISVGDSY